MKVLIILTLLLLSIFCVGQDTAIICKEKNLLVPKEYIQTHRYKGIITECENVETISESYNFLFKGFEKYGYTLCIDTTYDSRESLVIAQVIGYFDLVNNTDSIIKPLAMGWSIDNMGFGTEGKKDSLLQGDSIKIRYIILKALLRISNADLDSPLIPTGKNDDIITGKKTYIDNLNFLYKSLNPRANYFDI